MLILPVQFSAKVTQFALDLPSLFKETTLHPPRVCTGMELCTCTYSYRTTTRKHPAIFHKIELGLCFWSPHSVLITIFFLMFYIPKQGPSPCQKLKFKPSSLLLLSFRFNQDHSQPNLIWNYKVSCYILCNWVVVDTTTTTTTTIYFYYRRQLKEFTTI